MLPPHYRCLCGKCFSTMASFWPARMRYTTRAKPVKAGAFITSSADAHMFVLLVQSHGRMWGPPKGTVEDSESLAECAVREVREETGLSISVDNKQSTSVGRRVYLYHIHMQKAYIQPRAVPHNDSTAAGWFSVQCIQHNVEHTGFPVNHVLRASLQRFLDISVAKMNCAAGGAVTKWMCLRLSANCLTPGSTSPCSLTAPGSGSTLPAQTATAS